MIASVIEYLYIAVELAVNYVIKSAVIIEKKQAEIEIQKLIFIDIENIIKDYNEGKPAKLIMLHNIFMCAKFISGKIRIRISSKLKQLLCTINKLRDFIMTLSRSYLIELYHQTNKFCVKTVRFQL